MNSGLTLLSEERQLAAEVRELLETCAIESRAQPAVERLLTGYQRLMDDLHELLNLADRHERDMRLMNIQLQSLKATLSWQCEHDVLTGACNKLGITRLVERRMALEPCCLMLFDIDHFCLVNEVHGHPAGDRVLHALVERVQRVLADNDRIGRFGGEEFLVVSHAASIGRAHAFGELLRKTITAEPFLIAGGSAPIALTVSIGVTLARQGETASEAFSRADAALHRAKMAGRNRTVDA